MGDQLQLVATAEPTVGATVPPDGAHPRPPSGGIPPQTSVDATLRGFCPACGRWPISDATTGLIRTHKYPKWDAKNRRGRCAGTGTVPSSYRWLEPI